MSKFQVTKKDLLKCAKARVATAAQEQQEEQEDGDVLDADLRNEKSARWRREVLKKLLQDDEQKFKASDEMAQEDGQLAKAGKKRRIDLLAEPKVRLNLNVVPEPYRVRPSALIHNASDRILDLAMPKRAHAPPPSRASDGASVAEARTDSASSRQPYEISERLKALAQPKRSAFEAPAVVAANTEDGAATYARFVTPGQKSKEGGAYRMSRLLELTRIPRHKLIKEPERLLGAVPYSALMCRASPRVEELAGPKIRWSPKDNEYAFRTRPSALRYNPSTRIEHLAVAKIRRNTGND